MYVWWHHLILYVIIGVWLVVLELRVTALHKELEARDAIIGKLMVLADKFWKA